MKTFPHEVVRDVITRGELPSTELNVFLSHDTADVFYFNLFIFVYGDHISYAYPCPELDHCLNESDSRHWKSSTDTRRHLYGACTHRADYEMVYPSIHDQAG